MKSPWVQENWPSPMNVVTEVGGELLGRDFGRQLNLHNRFFCFCYIFFVLFLLFYYINYVNWLLIIFFNNYDTSCLVL